MNRNGGGMPTVSVKSSRPKRKAVESARDIYEKEILSKERRKIKKGTERRK